MSIYKNINKLSISFFWIWLTISACFLHVSCGNYINDIKPYIPAPLSSLSIGNGSLNPEFDSLTTSYECEVPYSTDSISLSADASSSIKFYVDEIPLKTESGTVIIELHPGVNIVSIRTSAHGKYSPGEYILRINRLPSSRLSSLNVENGLLEHEFTPDTSEYTLSVFYTYDRVNLTPFTEDPEAEIRINGGIIQSGESRTVRLFSDGNEDTIIAVTASDGSIAEYTFKIRRQLISSWTEHTVNGSVGSSRWNSVALSDDGNTIAAVSTESIFRTFDQGDTWHEMTSPVIRGWTSVALSGDGAAMTAAGPDGIWLFDSSGTDGTLCAGTAGPDWASVSSSPDFSLLAACAFGDYIYTSSDGGNTWDMRTFSGERDWADIAVSPDGAFIAAVCKSGSIFTSSDSGLSWNETASAPTGAGPWIAAAVFSSGLIAVCSEAGYIYSTTDGGSTWSEHPQTGVRNWTDICFDSAGEIVASASNSYIYKSGNSRTEWTQMISSGRDSWSSAAVSGANVIVAASNPGRLKISLNSGQIWNEFNGPDIRLWTSIASSSNGLRFAAADCGGYIYTYPDPDTDELWTEHQAAGRRKWADIAMSNDGSFIAACAPSDGMYISSDFGNAWEQPDSTSGISWKRIVCASDASFLAACATDDFIYISKDRGSSWSACDTSGLRNWQALCVSADGMRIAACEEYGYIYTSSDGGETWAAEDSAGIRYWQDITCSADGSFLSACEKDGNFVFFESDSTTSWPAELQEFQLEGDWQSIKSSYDGREMLLCTRTGSLYFFHNPVDNNPVDNPVDWPYSLQIIDYAGTEGFNSIGASANLSRIMAAPASASTLLFCE